jgi:hypothetical protein
VANNDKDHQHEMPHPSWPPSGPAPVGPRNDLLSPRQASTSTCLPQKLIDDLPACAVTCVQTFAANNYQNATCANTSDLNFLCTKSNLSGLSIGEGSIQCVVSFCTGQDQVNGLSYNVCSGIVSAVPKTVETITATVFGSSTTMASTMDTLPPTIGAPASTGNVSMIVMASASMMMTTPPPPAATSAPPPTSSSSVASASTPLNSSTTLRTSTTSNTSRQTSGVTAEQDQTKLSKGLTTPQLAGIAIGGAALVLVAAGLILLRLWMRRRRRERRKSNRKSRMVEQTPPPNYQSPTKAEPLTFGSSITVSSGGGRFYASTPPEDKRRSFWRRSIRPEDIGVAVSPRLNAGLSPPVSANSEQSFSHLLASPNAAYLGSGNQRGLPPRPDSAATDFDNESGTNWRASGEVVVDHQSFVLEKPPLAKRPRGPPPMLTLPKVPQSPPKDSATRIPLTPTYDNGNIQLPPSERTYGSPPSQAGPLPAAEHRLPESSTYAGRNVLRRKNSQRLPLRAESPPNTVSVQPRTPPRQPISRPAMLQQSTWLSDATPTNRESTISSAFTEIEEDTSPEESNKQLEPAMLPAAAFKFAPDSRKPDAKPNLGSPIRELRYPDVPRSAAVSKQAEQPAQPRASQGLMPPPLRNAVAQQNSRPNRDQLVRAEASFVQTDSTSPNSFLSDVMEFPEPPTIVAPKGSLAQLRNNPSGSNQRPVFHRQSSSLDAVVAPNRIVTIPQRSPSTKARLTPGKSSSGDLYLTVEM